MNARDGERWLERYVEAWKTYDREQIAALSSDAVSYRCQPYDDRSGPTGTARSPRVP